ncbi:MAG: hypothetical protein GF311_01440 [Candidatus Lokiarchaeota archaeon]|nr:hypothetical protein [Candidatus Lokiarchaeota archaeon]
MNRKKIQTILILIIGFLMVFSFIELSLAWENRFSGRMNEIHQGTYCFNAQLGEDIGKGKSGTGFRVHSYGVHDWIADSALRLVLKDEIYGKFAGEIFPSEINDPSQSIINLIDIQSEGITKKTEMVGGVPKFTYYFNYYTDKDYIGGDRNQFLLLRRYVNYLHGTYLPDKFSSNILIMIEEDFVPEEEILHSYPAMRTHAYQLWIKKIEPNSYFYKEENIDGILGAEWHANMAYLFSKYESRVSYDNGQTYETITGKYEAMAQCLGSMAHFIADMSYPGHLRHERKEWSGRMLSSYNKALEDEFHCYFSDESFSNGGPCWRFFNFENFEINPTIPYFAARDVGRKTYDGENGKESEINDTKVFYTDYKYHRNYYKFKNPNASMNLPKEYPDSGSVPRLKVIIENAVHQTANALAFMLEKCLNRTCHEDTIGKRGTKEIIVLDEIELEVPTERPSDYEEIEDILKSDDSNREKTEKLTAAMRLGLTSLLGLGIIALLQEILKKVLTKSPIVT